MLKKLLFTSSLAVGLFAANNVKNLEQFKKLPFMKGNVKIVKGIDLGNLYELKVKFLTRKGMRTTEVFVTKDKKYFILGKGFDKNGTPLNIPINMAKYKKDAAFKIGSGKEEYYVFTDPECPFCKKLEKYIPELSKQATFYFYLFPLSFHKHSKDMSYYILSLPKDKRAEALHKMQVEGDNSFSKAKYSTNELKEIQKALNKEQNIAKELGVRGTPTIYNKSGTDVNWGRLVQSLNN